MARAHVLRLAGGLHSLRDGVLPSQVQRILLLRPDHLGDVLLSTPALQLLRHGFPHADLTLMVGPWSAEVADRQTCIDRVAQARFPGFARDAPMGRARRYSSLIALARRLKRERFDLGIVLRNDFWWGAWLLAAARVPLRLGYSTTLVRPFLTHALTEPSRRHASIDALELAASAAVRWGDGVTSVPWQFGAPPLTFAVRERDRRMAESLLREAGVVSTCFILVHVGSGTEVKRLPPERWAMIVDHVRKFVHAHVVVTSGNHPDERATARALCDKTAAILLAPPQSFGALGAVMQRARVSIGADSGAMHLAVAVGCPSVTLFGPADPTVFGPWGDPSRHAIVKSGLICSPCDVLDWPPAQVYYHPCMRRLEPEVVARAAARVAPAEPLGNE